MKYLVETQEFFLTFKIDKTSCLKCYVDAVFAVHSSFKSHTREALTMGKLAIISVSHTKIEHENQQGGVVSRCE